MIKAEVQGEYKEELPTVTFSSGCTYTGEWIYGEREGKGLQSFPNGSSYEGEWKGNKINGKGKITFGDGDCFEGEWVDDKANGFGAYIHRNGAVH